jgi:glutamate racemase
MGKKQLLGIFDSGVGGFSVLKEIRNMTDVDILYYGDCKNAPYGNKSQEEIVFLIKNILLHLKKEGVTHFMSACNSMSVNTTEALLQEVGIDRNNYIDMIDGVHEIQLIDGANVLIVGTEATITSHIYQSIFSNKVVAYRTYIPTMLAGAIEQNDMPLMIKTITDIVVYAKSIHATHILYACTHYPLVDVGFKQKAAELGFAGMFVNPAVYVAELVTGWNMQGSRQIRLETSLETEVFKEYKNKYSVTT